MEADTSPLVGTSFEKTRPFEKFNTAPSEESKIQACKAKGGTWNIETQSCDLPKLKTELEKPEVFTSKDQGRPSGIIVPARGNKPEQTFLGLQQKDVESIAASEQAKVTLPEGTTPVGTAEAIASEQQRKINLAKGVGAIDFATAQQIESEGINLKQAFAAGGISGAKIGGAAAISVGTTAGGAALIATGPAAPIAAPTAALIGGGAGAVGGFTTGFFIGIANNIKEQRTDLVTTKKTSLRKRITSANNYISGANANPASADEMKEAYILVNTLIMRDYNTLIRESEVNLIKWGSDATPQIVDFEVYFETVKPSMDIRMEQAILKPDPTRAYLKVGDEE